MLREYRRVIPVLAGQIREAASRIEHAVADIATATLRVSSDRSLDGGNVDQLMRSSRDAVHQMRIRGRDQARRSMEAAAALEDAIGALKILSLHAGQGTTVADGIRSLVSGLEGSLTQTMTDLRRRAEADAASLAEDTATAERAIALLGAHHAATAEVSRAVAALQYQDSVDQRLQGVIETLSEMQDEFVAALERPQERTDPGSAALRLRHRYTAAAAARR